MSEGSLKVRKMNAGDISWVMEIGEGTPEFRTGTGSAQFYNKETLNRWVNDPNGVTLIAEVEGNRAGFLLGYYMAGPNDGYINMTAVEPRFRKRGVGKLLQEETIKEFENKGPEGHKCDHIFGVVSESDIPMLNLKKKVGFEIGSKFHYVDMMLPRSRIER